MQKYPSNPRVLKYMSQGGIEILLPLCRKKRSDIQVHDEKLRDTTIINPKAYKT